MVLPFQIFHKSSFAALVDRYNNQLIETLKKDEKYLKKLLN
jgi:hypothetical protein